MRTERSRTDQGRAYWLSPAGRQQLITTAALRRPCPQCAAGAGERCRFEGGEARRLMHPQRLLKVAQ